MATGSPPADVWPNAGSIEHVEELADVDDMLDERG